MGTKIIIVTKWMGCASLVELLVAIFSKGPISVILRFFETRITSHISLSRLRFLIIKAQKDQKSEKIFFKIRKVKVTSGALLLLPIVAVH